MKHTKISAVLTMVACIIGFASCSSDPDEIVRIIEKDRVSFEGRAFFAHSIIPSIRFTGAKTAYVVFAELSGITDGEAICTYSATDTMLTLQPVKLPLKANGTAFSENDFIMKWKTDSWRKEYIGYETSVLVTTGKVSVTENGVTTEIDVADREKTIEISRWAEGEWEKEEKAETTESTAEPEGEYTSITADFIKNDAEEITGAKAVIETVVIKNGKKTTATTTRTYSQEVASKALSFYAKYHYLSDDDWHVVHNAFKPFTFGYEKDKKIKEIYYDDSGKGKEITSTYELYLMQHYSVFERANFSYLSSDGAIAGDFNVNKNALCIVAASQADKNQKYYIYDVEPFKKTVVFGIYYFTGKTQDFAEPAFITAKYEVNENGDESTLKCIFGKAEDENGKEKTSLLDGKEILFTYYASHCGLKEY